MQQVTPGEDPIPVQGQHEKKTLQSDVVVLVQYIDVRAIELITDKSLLVLPLLVMALLVMALLVMDSPRWEFFKSSH